MAVRHIIVFYSGIRDYYDNTVNPRYFLVMKNWIKLSTLLAFGITIVFKSYVIVIGQTKPVLVALNKGEATMAIIDPGTMMVVGKVPVGDGAA